MGRFGLWNLCALCAFVVKKDEPQRHEEHKGCTKKNNVHFHAACSQIDLLPNPQSPSRVGRNLEKQG